MANPFTRLIRRNRLIDQLMNLQGNAKWCVACEPLWAISNALYVAYAVNYKKEILGINNANLGTMLGTLVTIQMIVQVISAFAGGVLVDKMGRKNSLMLFELIANAFSVLIIAFAQNFWWFAVASAFSGCWQINSNAWNGLITEDCPPKEIPTAFSGISMIQLGATFLTPISIVLVNRFTLIATMRWVYFVSFLMQVCKVFIQWGKMKETTQGLQRMQETKDIPFFKMFVGYGHVFKIIFTTPVTVLLLILVVTLGLNNIIINTFFYDFATAKLGISSASLGYIPMIRALVSLLFMFLAQSKINEQDHQKVLSAGLIFYAVAFACPVVFQNVSWLGAVLYIFFEAIAHAFVYPRKESLLFLYVDKTERSRVYAMLHVIAMGITSPFGTIMGMMSDANRLYPFFFAILVSICCSVLMRFAATEKKAPTQS